MRGDVGEMHRRGGVRSVLAREEALVGDDGRDEDRLVDEERVDDEEEEAYRATHAAEIRTPDSTPLEVGEEEEGSGRP